jgi:hypothetical protein
MSVLYEWNERGDDRAAIIARAKARKAELDPDNGTILMVGPCRVEFQRMDQAIVGWIAPCELVERGPFLMTDDDEKLAELASIVDGLIEVVANMTNHVDGWKQPGGDPTALNRTHRLARRVAALRREDD